MYTGLIRMNNYIMKINPAMNRPHIVEELLNHEITWEEP